MDEIQSLLLTNDSKEAPSSLIDMSRLGSRRSIVRRIGSNLPLSSAARPIFELLPNGSHIVRSSGKNSIFSLADVVYLDDAPESSVAIRASAPNLIESVYTEIPVTSPITTSSITSSASQEHMVTKISALEDELSSLRSQIAALAMTQLQRAPSFNISISSNSEPPNCTSTPIKGPPAPPPPPPPPPAPPFTPYEERLSVQDIIRQRKHGKASSPTGKSVQRIKSQSSVPDMADILKDLHKVKLKSVSRTPGGTPLNNKKKDYDSVAGDAASLIAMALKKKFAHRKNFESPKAEEQDDSFESYSNISPKRKNFESPNTTPKFGQHLLKRRNTSPAPAVKPKPKLPTFLKKRRDLENSGLTS